MQRIRACDLQVGDIFSFGDHFTWIVKYKRNGRIIYSRDRKLHEVTLKKMTGQLESIGEKSQQWVVKHGHKSLSSQVIIQMDSNGNVINEFNSITEAWLKTGIGRTNICDAVNNRISTSGGYKWKRIKQAA